MEMKRDEKYKSQVYSIQRGNLEERKENTGKEMRKETLGKMRV